VRVEQARARECVGRYEEFLMRTGVLTAEHAGQVRAAAEQALRDGIAAAEAEPAPSPELLFEHAYVDPPPSLRNG
jgi:TPP-dependent pyruvate/acetoin dehydrogenase alpha subunit